MLIHNFDQLASSEPRKITLQIVEAGLEAIQPDQVINKHFPDLHLENFDRVFLLGFGKGSAGLSKLIEKKVGDKFVSGEVIDLVSESSDKITFTVGTHPLPSQINANFTKNALARLTNLTEKDLVLVVVCGGGSALFTLPHTSLEQVLETNRTLLHSGANITEMNAVRKKLDAVKGGGLAKLLYPAQIVSFIFSDVPGNDLSTIASGPLVKDDTTVEEAWSLAEKYRLPLKKEDLKETPKDEKFFHNVQNLLLLSNITALEAMEVTATSLGFSVDIVTDKIEGEAREVGRKIVKEIKEKTVQLYGGETSVTAKGQGEGGRNQEVVLGALTDWDQSLGDKLVICSVASDGWDNTSNGGAIGDIETIKKSREMGLDSLAMLTSNDSFHFFEKVGDGIQTGRLPSNVADLIVVLRN